MARLRSGFTTGSCSAAAAKAAVTALVEQYIPEKVDIPFPGNKRYSFVVSNCSYDQDEASASIIKDAGDDPDVTNGAEIMATARYRLSPPNRNCIQLGPVQVCRGAGVGFVTKPGLCVPVGEPAINPVPRKMIQEAVQEAYRGAIHITLSIKDGAQLAKKTLNHRLGIIEGLSILGTTGIVRPISADSWTATISASMNVARETGLKEIVLSTGRTSEKSAQEALKLPVEAYIQMGDYLKFSLEEAAKKEFTTIHISIMWGKATKAALKIPQTHVRNGALEIKACAEMLVSLGAEKSIHPRLFDANTAREMLTILQENGRHDIITAVCRKAQEYGEEISGLPVKIYLVNNQAEVIASV